MIVLVVFISPNVCFCISWENPDRRNRIKCNRDLGLYFVGFISPGSAETMSAVKKLDSHLIASFVKNISVKSY